MEHRDANCAKPVIGTSASPQRDRCRTQVQRAAFRCLLALCAGFALPLQAAAPDIAMHSTAHAFGDVKERLTFAIENRGLVVNYTARVGAMLERTGGDIGSSRPIYANAEVIEFCSAALSRATMEADPHNIAYCPYAIAVYVLAREPQRVYVTFRKLGKGSGTEASRKALDRVDRLLAEIVREALN